MHITGLLFAILALSGAYAEYVHLEWNITWVRAAPDGFSRPLIGINHQWPCPQVDVNLGDIMVVDVYNDLGNQSTGIHWHGFYQHTTNMMDGAVKATQCPIPPGNRMRYEFTVNQTGTYWYHSHEVGQYPDGLRGALLVHDKSTPFHYDDEFTLTLTDFYHEQMPTLIKEYESPSDGELEPLPDSALINDARDTTVHVAPGKTYLVHLICVANWPGHAIIFDSHDLTVVEVDGVYTDPYPTGEKYIRLAPGQRMSVLMNTKNETSRNYAIWDTMDMNMMFFYEDRPIPENFNPNVTAWLVYDDQKPLPPPPDIHHLDANTDFVDDVIFVPADHEEILEPVDRQIILDTGSSPNNGSPRYTVNNQTYIPQQTPTLYTALDAEPGSLRDPALYGQVNPLILEYGDIVEIVINNHHNNLHPWHLHGHQFQVLQRSAVNGGYFNGYFQNVSSTPVRRDTIMVQNHGHTVIRFRADNPVWLLHCHIEWHMVAGLIATVIAGPEHLQAMRIPPDHLALCENQSGGSNDGRWPYQISDISISDSGLNVETSDVKASVGSS